MSLIPYKFIQNYFAKFLWNWAKSNWVHVHVWWSQSYKKNCGQKIRISLNSNTNKHLQMKIDEISQIFIWSKRPNERNRGTFDWHDEDYFPRSDTWKYIEKISMPPIYFILFFLATLKNCLCHFLLQAFFLNMLWLCDCYWICFVMFKQIL